MATRVKILSEQLANKIAAGEVVERPSSVVKELVENALDAGAREVVIEIEGGGKRLIRVADDGCGMSREDALLALERHATSKIVNEDDLASIATLGFRGEALPSIASVARCTLATRERGRIEGTEIYSEGGVVKEVKASGMAEGTVLTVRNLFFNTPARLKFMRSSETEVGHVGEVVTRLALSAPDVRFTFINDGKAVFRLLDGDMHLRIRSLLGDGVGSSLVPIDHDVNGISLRGMVSSPDCTRSSGSQMYTFVNGRYIRDRVVQSAILSAYRNFLERGRFPIVVLFIVMPNSQVDVNVHPTKHEVRFREQSVVHDAIRLSLERVLAKSPWIKSGTAPVMAVPEQRSHLPVTAAEHVAEVREALFAYRMPDTEERTPFRVPTASPAVAGRPVDRQAESGHPGYFSSLGVIGQLGAAYILCQDDSDLVIIDQHAAHERVAFESLKRQFDREKVEGQGLLFPQTMDLTPREAAALRTHRDEIARFGFSVEEFGGTTWVVTAVPRMLARTDFQRVLRDIFEDCADVGRSRSFADARDGILVRIACHSVVRGVHPLSREEITALLRQMDATDFAANCPHGRPVFRTISRGELEKMFGRA